MHCDDLPEDAKIYLPPSPLDIDLTNQLFIMDPEIMRKSNHGLESATHDTGDLEMRLSPIYKLNFDILSMIFLTSWETTEGTQRTLASVCRFWREVAVAMPRLWSRISPLPPEDEDYIPIMLTRSATLPLHIIMHDLTNQQQLRSLSLARERIHCMTVRDELGAFETSLPSLRRIEFSVYGGQASDRTTQQDSASLFDVDKFPNLRELYLSSCPAWVLTAIAPSKRFPPLQRLHIICDFSKYWISIIRNCEDSLVSLKMLLGYPPPPQDLHLVLPRLRHLELAGHGVRMRIDAPLLESLEELLGEGKYLTQRSRGTPSLPHSLGVTVLHSSRLPLEINRYPQLRSLRLSNEAHSWEELGASVGDGLDACPLLRAIRYRHYRYSTIISGAEIKKALLGDRLPSERRIIVEEFVVSQMRLPGSMPRDECSGMPCTY